MIENTYMYIRVCVYMYIMYTHIFITSFIIRFINKNLVDIIALNLTNTQIILKKKELKIRTTSQYSERERHINNKKKVSYIIRAYVKC